MTVETEEVVTDGLEPSVTDVISETFVAEKPLAVVAGEPWLTLPDDLYIPPEALRVFLETFQGPLDLLWYLIKKSNLDILNIPIAAITHQYMQYVELMKDMALELVGDYLVMAAMLAEIKSRMLLPRLSSEEAQEEDPRAELVRRLQEYERFQKAALNLDVLPRRERDFFSVEVLGPELSQIPAVLPNVQLHELQKAFWEVMQRASLHAHHHIKREPLSIRERMTRILENLQKEPTVEFTRLFQAKEGRISVVVSFIAILELLKQSLVEIVQVSEFSPIYLKAITV